jgi:hypothetical protein
MTRKTITLKAFILTAISPLGSAQVKMGNRPETVHPRAALEAEHNTKESCFLLLKTIQNYLIIMQHTRPV